MPLTSFCGLLTLQVGVAVISAIFFTLSAMILAANLFNYGVNSIYSWPLNLVLLIIFVVGLIIAALLMFASSYGETRSLALIAVVIILLVMCYWVILSCFSFANNAKHVGAVCVDARCPETLWIANLDYRNYRSGELNSNYDYAVSYRDDPAEYTKENDNVDDGQDKKRNYHFVGAIILFIVNLLFFLFSAFIVWSWAAELDWADYYIEDEPVVVYEEEPYYS